MIATEALAAGRIDLDAIEERLSGLTPDQLRARFFECFRGAAEFLAEAAMCIKRLVDQGEEIDGMSKSTLDLHLKIARGEIDAEAAWMANEAPGRQTILSLPVEVQRQLAAEPEVEVIEPTPSGKGFTKRRHNLFEAPRDVICKAIDRVERRIRTPEEQAAYLKAQQARPSPLPIPAQTFAAEKPNIPRTVRFTESELEAIRLHAAINHLSEGEMIRRFLIRAGAFKRPKT